jgi:dienelactone hydrolase
MAGRIHSRLMNRHLQVASLFSALVFGAPAFAAAQIDTGIIEKQKAALDKQTTDPDQKREGGTQPRDWDYQLPEGVRTRQVTFYVDGGTALYGKLFLPKGFSTKGRLPAVVVGHGINALSIGIEKFAARFAERGLVAMAIDYQSYGFSSSGSDDIRLLENDTTTDLNAVTEKDARILLKRTNLNNVHEVADFRAAVSFLQGEPGIDPDKIGIWGSSNGGSVVIAVAAVDARVKAVVSQVASPRPAPRVPVPVAANLLKDAITRVREGQGAEVDGGFSFRSKVDQWSTQRNRDVRPGQTLDQIRPTTAVLFLPAEKDELTQGAGGAIEASKFLSGRGVPSQAIVLPALTHFQAYSNAGFEVGSNLAADWFLKYLSSATRLSPDPLVPLTAAGGAAAGAMPKSSPDLPAGITTREVVFFSEGVKAHGKLFLPSGFSAASNAGAVVVAPNVGQKATSVEPHAIAAAQRGLVAMAIDYRGWGKSGALIYLADPVRWDDRLRFSQHTAKVKLRRRRIMPEAQVIDIRNAITYLQGEPGVDATRIGVAGSGLAGAHVVAVAANDARVKAGVSMLPWEDGKGVERKSFAPSTGQQNAMVRLARTGAVPNTDAAAAAMNAEESKLAFAEYQPFRQLDQVSKDTQLLFLDGAGTPSFAADFLAKALGSSGAARQ